LTDTKELIDSVEEKNEETIKLEKKVEFLKNTINRLKLTIQKQKRLVAELKKSENSREDIPNDVKILKDLVSTQREDLKNKDTTISRLENESIQLKSKLAESKEKLANSVDKDRLLGLKERIRTLVKEKEKAQDKINSLQTELEQIGGEKTQKELHEEIKIANQEIEDLKREKENSNAQIDYLQKKVETFINAQSSQSKLNQEINSLRDTLDETEKENKALTNKVNQLEEKLRQFRTALEKKEQEKEDLVGQVKYFQEELEKIKNKNFGSIDKSNLMEEIYNQITQEQGFVNEKIVDYEQKIIELEKVIEKKEEKIESLRKEAQDSNNLQNDSQIPMQKSAMAEESKSPQKDQVKSMLIDQNTSLDTIALNAENIPQFYQKNLIEYMFSIMNENHKQNVIDFLIQNLDSNNPQIRRYTIKILSKVQTSKVFNALIDRISDDDWLVRYYMVNALKSFSEFNGVKKVLREYLNDLDVDVREAAKEALKEIE